MEILKTDALYFAKPTIKLFNRTIKMPVPSLEKGEQISKERLIKEIKESLFYTRLAKISGIL